MIAFVEVTLGRSPLGLRGRDWVRKYVRSFQREFHRQASWWWVLVSPRLIITAAVTSLFTVRSHHYLEYVHYEQCRAQGWQFSAKLKASRYVIWCKAADKIVEWGKGKPATTRPCCPTLNAVFGQFNCPYEGTHRLHHQYTHSPLSSRHFGPIKAISESLPGNSSVLRHSVHVTHKCSRNTFSVAFGP